MKRLIFLLALVAALGPPAAAQSYYLSPDVPTDDPDGAGPILLPWDIVWMQAGNYNVVASLPAGTAIDSLHQMCTGDWLFSVEAPTELPVGSGTVYLPRDVIWTDGASYALHFSGGANGLPLGTNIDAAFLNGGDSAPLIISFDVPTTIGAATYEPADLVRVVGPSTYALFWDASAILPPVLTSDNVTAADHRLTTVLSGPSILSLDVPSAITVPDTVPGETVQATALGFAPFFLDPGWKLSSRLDALALPADPGEVPWLPPQSLRVTKSLLVPGGLDLIWGPSGSAGANDYCVQEGNLQNLRPVGYTHGMILPSTGGVLTATIVPAAWDTYYIVVALNDYDEGSYGRSRSLPPPVAAERPQGAPSCRPTQALGCP